MKGIRYILRILGLYLLIMTNSNCSFLNKVTVLDSRKSSNWEDCDVCYKYSNVNLSTKSYQFRADSFLITICPCAKPGFNILFGPPFVPVIPNPFILFPAKPNAKFFVDMKIDNKGESLSLDLSKFQFQIIKDSLTKPSLIKLIVDKQYGQPEELFGKYENYTDSVINKNIITITQPLIIRFEFSILTTKVKRLSIRFDSLPEIEFRKHIKFVYKPFVFAS